MTDYKNLTVKEPLTLKQALKNMLDGLMFVLLIGGSIFIWLLLEVK